METNRLQFPKQPPITILSKIIKVVKKLAGIFKDHSKEVGQTDSEDSLENIDRVTTIFTDFKKQVHSRAEEIEQVVMEEIEYYVEELQDILSENAKKVSDYGVHTQRIEREINKISERIKGVIDKEVSRTVSLDNPECRAIVKMIPGSKKEAAIQLFFEKTLRSALNECCETMRSSLDEIYEDVECEVVGAVEQIQKQIERWKESFSTIDENNYEETAKMHMVDAYYIQDVCDQVLELV